MARRWCTGTRGSPAERASPLAKFTPTSSAPISPGAQVTAMPSIWESCFPLWDRASCTTPVMASLCSREAISGTTPPNTRCRSIWEATTEESICLPSSTIAAAVSSQELSMPKRIICLCLPC